MSAKFYKDKDSFKDLPKSSGSIVSSNRLEDVLSYHAQDFNVIPIPKPGQQTAGVSNDGGGISSKNTDGRAQKGMLRGLKCNGNIRPLLAAAEGDWSCRAS